MPGQQQGAAPIEHLLRRCPGDDDWFSLALKKDDARQIQIGFEHDKGDLSLSLYKDEEETAAMTSDTSSPEQGGEGLALQADADAMYYLHITGPAEASNFYMLRVETPEPKQGDGDNQDDEEEQQDEEDQKKEQKQEQEQEQEQQKPIEQMMDHLDRQKQPNLEAEKALRAMPNVQAPGGKVW
jgi:hypothetical protein